MEYVVWGIPPDANPIDVGMGLAEQPLYTRATTLAEAERVAGLLERSHGCRRLRIQSIDTTAPGETVAGMFRAAVARPAKR